MAKSDGRGALYMLLLWAVYSDAVFTSANVGSLFANSEVQWADTCGNGGLSKSMGILVMFFIIPITAGAGNVAYLWAGKKWKIDSKKLLVFSLMCSALVPAYGLIGLGSKTIGLRYGWEMLMIAAWYGLHLGSMQSYSRSIFSTLIPRGKEGAFYSAYELTNRGSSWVGPIVLTAVQQATGELRYALIFLLITTVLPAVLLGCYDLRPAQKLVKASHAEEADLQGPLRARAGAGASPAEPGAVAAATAAAKAVELVEEALHHQGK